MSPTTALHELAFEQSETRPGGRDDVAKPGGRNTVVQVTDDSWDDGQADVDVRDSEAPESCKGGVSEIHKLSWRTRWNCRIDVRERLGAAQEERLNCHLGGPGTDEGWRWHQIRQGEGDGRGLNRGW